MRGYFSENICNAQEYMYYTTSDTISVVSLYLK